MAKRRRSNKKEPKGVIYLIVLACLAAVFHEPIANALHNKLPVPAEKTAKRAETTETTGNPLLPAPLKNVPEQILHRKGYTASYNREHKIPNWVAWELTPEKLIERESRTDKFLPDPDLPESQAVTTDDYKRSGMDRGHMCPAGDNRWHWKAMQESFYMTNICPQNHNLNRGDWKELEEACRLWAKKRRENLCCLRPCPLPPKAPHYRKKTQDHRTRSIFQSHTLHKQQPTESHRFCL